MPLLRQGIDAQPGGRPEIEVHAGQIPGILGEPDDHGGDVEGTDHVDARIIEGDVHHHDAIDQIRADHPSNALNGILTRFGQEDDVVAMGPRGPDDRQDESHERHRIGLGVHRRGEGDDLRARRSEHLSTGIGTVAELLDRLLDARRSRRGDGALAGEDVGHRGDRDARTGGDIRDRRHHHLLVEALRLRDRV